MAYVTECPDHDRCNLIVKGDYPSEAGSWQSHFADDVAAEARLNPDDPDQATIEDRRADAADGATLDRRAPTQSEQARLNGETRRPAS